MDDFIHIPKTSGSSLRTVLSRQYGIQGIAYFEPGNPQLKGQDALVALKENLATRDIALVTGHHSFGLHAVAGRPLRYFSTLRDPISRAASDYFFAYSYAHHRLREEILDGSLTPEAFLIEGRRAGPFDLQCRIVSGRGDARPGLADLAFETIERCFVVVGVAELFTESLLLMAKRLGWKPPLYANRNVTRLPAEIEDKRRRIEETVRSRFADRYADDLKLHARTTAKLRRDIAIEGPRFERALGAFQELQGSIGKLDDAHKHERYEFAATDRLPDFASAFADREAYRVLSEYLQPSSTPPRARNYVGHVDLASGRAVAGWVADLCDKEPIGVRVCRAGRQIGAGIAANNRPDVSAALSIRSDVGFRIGVDEEIADKGDIDVFYEDTDIPI